jgi:hypothetical protein
MSINISVYLYVSPTYFYLRIFVLYTYF